MDLDFEELGKKENEIVYDLKSLEASCYVDLSGKILKPEILLSIGEYNYKGKLYPIPVMTASEFSAIVAVSKAKKSFLKSAFIACYIGGKANTYFSNIRSHRTQDYTILDFDTEMSSYYAQTAFRRTLEMVGGNYEHYFCYVTRHLSSPQRLQIIDYCLKNQNKLYKVPIKFVSIDGIADLVENTNDIIMSKEASDYITKWTYEYNIHITTVIHKSGQTGKPLGHLGTYILKKAESVIDLQITDKKTILVSNPYSRGYSFDSFEFDINGNSLPYLIENIF